MNDIARRLPWRAISIAKDGSCAQHPHLLCNNLVLMPNTEAKSVEGRLDSYKPQRESYAVLSFESQGRAALVPRLETRIGPSALAGLLPQGAPALSTHT